MHKIGTLLGAGLLSIMAVAAHAAPDSLSAANRSATLATDVNGFRLGMTMSEIGKLAKLERIGDFQYDAEGKGVNYNFQVTPLGRVFRVTSSQDLGAFQVDQKFLATLKSQLLAKYGKPTGTTGETFEWQLIQPVINKLGQTLPFCTMWMSAYVGGGYSSNPTLEITILDFRILWADETKLNDPARQSAEQRLRF